MEGAVLVTGGAGFIGSHSCEALLCKGFKVISLDNFNDFYPPEFKYLNIHDVNKLREQLGLGEDCFTSINGDIRDRKLLDEIFEKYRPDAVIHMAAYAGVRPSIENPALYSEVNVTGTVNLLECMRKYRVTKLVFASSSSVYGNNEKVPFSETDNVDNPISPYAATKKAGELLCSTYHHLYGINTACLRFFTVYGPRQRPDLAIYKFTENILEGKPLQVYGDGSSKRDYTYIEDIIDGVLKALNWTDSEEKRYSIFNLGGASPVTLIQLVNIIENIVDVSVELVSLPAQPGDVEKTCADISHSMSVLGYCPKTGLEEGIKKFFDWYLNRRKHIEEKHFMSITLENVTLNEG